MTVCVLLLCVSEYTEVNHASEAYDGVERRGGEGEREQEPHTGFGKRTKKSQTVRNVEEGRRRKERDLRGEEWGGRERAKRGGSSEEEERGRRGEEARGR